MSLEAMQWAWKQDVGPVQKLVLLALADFANESGCSWPSVGRLSSHTGIAKRQIVRHLRGIQDVGLVSKTVRRRENGGQSANEYRLMRGGDGKNAMRGDVRNAIHLDGESYMGEGVENAIGGDGVEDMGGMAKTPPPYIKEIDPTIEPCAAAAPPPRTKVVSNSLKTLQHFLPRLLEMIKAAHPRAVLPRKEGRDWFKWLCELERLHTIDGYTSEDIISCLTWIFQEDAGGSDGFRWADQIQSVPALRHRKSSDSLSKFAKVYEHWKHRTGGRQEARSVAPPRAMTEAEALARLKAQFEVPA